MLGIHTARDKGESTLTALGVMGGWKDQNTGRAIRRNGGERRAPKAETQPGREGSSVTC